MNRDQADTFERELDSYQKIARRTGEPSNQNASGHESADRTAWARFAAAAGASLSAATSAEAAITWVVPPQPIRVEIPFDAFVDATSIDIDGNGQVDLEVAASVDFGYPTFNGYRYTGVLDGVNNFDLIGLAGYPGIIHKLAAGAVIPAVAPAVTGTVVRMSATSSYAIASAQGEWTYDDTGFAGFVFGPSGSKRAGWIQIRTESFFNGVTPRLGAIEILEWAFQTVPGTSIQVGQTSSAAIPGDYDGNGSVGPEDYDKWKTDFNKAVVAGTGADGNENAKVDAADYTVWRDNLGASGSASLSGAVPEPSAISLGMLALGAAGITALRRR